MDNQRLADLFQRKIAGTLLPEELAELRQLIEEPGLKSQWERLIDQLLLDVPGLPLPEENAQATLEAIFRAGLSPVVPMYRRRNWLRIAAAAAVFFVIGISSYFLLFDKISVKTEQVKRDEPADVSPPSSNRATITLSGGRIIYLDSAASGTLTTQQLVQLTKLADGKIAYSGSASELVYNTLTNPRGSQVIDMTLADGSRVWLNAGSSLTYPVAFIGNERKIQVTGEAYFEVAHDKTKPFYVNKGGMTVQVLGTRFNVNTYDDERDIRVTLLEGSVEVENQGLKARIQPGEQAIVAGSGQPVINKQVNVEQVMAWKNGKFDFGEGMDLKAIMRQLARWYDVQVEYNGEVKQEFIGTVSRQVNVSKVLEKFELTGRVHFKIEGKKILVNP